MMEKQFAGNDVQNWNSFDILKLLCACLVVGIHTQPFDGLGIIDFGFGFITRFAVPVFFLLSGFFLFKENVTAGKVLRYCVRILTMYVVWCGIYCLMNFLIGKENPATITQLVGGGGYSSLWYLQSLIVATLVVWLLLKLLKREWLVFAITLCLYSVGLVLGTYYPVFERFAVIRAVANTGFAALIGTRNGLFYGSVYVMAGLLLRRKCRLHLKPTVLLFAVSMLLFMMETVVATFVVKVTSTVLWVFLLPSTFFLCALVGSWKLKSHKAYPFVRRMSTAIYLVHMPINMILSGWLHGVVSYAVVLVLSIGIAMVAAMLPREKYQWIGYIC